MPAIRCLVLLFAALIYAGLASAERSRLTQEADVVEAGDCEVESAGARERARGKGPARESSLELNCGVGASTEVSLLVARRRSDNGRERGMGLEGKTGLVPRRQAGIGWSLAYGLARLRENAGPWRTAEHFVALEASHQVATAWLLVAQLGTLRERIERRDRTRWSLAAEHALLAERLELKLELGGDDRDRRRRPQVGAALRLTLWPDDFSLTLRYEAGPAPNRERRTGLGLAYEF